MNRTAILLAALLLTGCEAGSRKAVQTLARPVSMPLEAILPICQAGLVAAVKGDAEAMGAAIDKLPEHDRANAGTVCTIYIIAVGEYRRLLAEDAAGLSI